MALKNAFQLWSSRVCEKRSKVEWLSLMKPAIPLRDMFCIFFTYIFVFGAQRLIIAFLSFSSCKQIKTSQQFFQSQLFCKQKNNIHVTCCGHCCFLGVTKTKTLENEDLRPKTRLSFRDYEN